MNVRWSVAGIVSSKAMEDSRNQMSDNNVATTTYTCV